MERKSRQLNDDDFCFDARTIVDADGKHSSFSRTAVRRNTETGEIQGWQEFYHLVSMDDPTMGGEMEM